jgi:DNA invertase Pin-like site-specific DNA recombinase
MTDFRKISARHLKRKAYLYIRQSTIFQTEQNRESTERQYRFREQAVALGWHPDQVVVIDDDLGRSAADADRRPGFQRLVADVGLGQVGIVLSLEVSRLARNCSDWHRLMELCALSDTLILDEDGLYDLNQFNDRLLLGLRGTMSEAELHFLRGRLEGGKLNKARRGELRTPLPAGFVHDTEGRIVQDPDREVQAAIRCIFSTFAAVGSAWMVVRRLAQAEVRLPVRVRTGASSGQIRWAPPTLSRVLHVLKNPRFAGAYFYGRSRQKKGAGCRALPRDQWKVFIADAHPGYINWEAFEANQKALQQNRLKLRDPAAMTPLREGPALLQGLVVCGECGRRMSIRYQYRRGRVDPTYYCQRQATQYGGALCQQVPGRAVDRAVGRLAVEALAQEAVEAALAVHEELGRQHEELAAVYRGRVERAKHEAAVAERQFLLVNPENRLVADTLEKRWNDSLRAVGEAEEAFAKWGRQHPAPVDGQTRQQVNRLIEDFPAVWNHPRTTARERKQMLRLLIEDVTLRRREEIEIGVRWKGGATSQLHVPIPRNAFDARRTDAAALECIAAWAEKHTDEEIAERLNAEGKRTGTGQPFTHASVQRLRQEKKVAGLKDHLREAGLRTTKEIGAQTGVKETTLREWRRAGLIHAVRCDHKHWLYEFPTPPVLERIGNALAGKQVTALATRSNVGGAV